MLNNRVTPFLFLITDAPIIKPFTCNEFTVVRRNINEYFGITLPCWNYLLVPVMQLLLTTGAENPANYFVHQRCGSHFS